MSGQSETKHVQPAIIKWLNSLPGVWAWRRNVGVMKIGKRWIRFGQEGQADVEGIILITLPGVADPIGVHLEVECKAKGKTPTDKQGAYLTAARTYGAVALWADSVAMLKYKMRREYQQRGWEWPA